MAFTSIGYDGTVTEGPWAQFSTHIGGDYHVGDGIATFRVTAAGAGDRAVTVATGDAYGRGVYDISDEAVVKNLNSVGSGSRWDLICLHRAWGSNTTSIEVIEGGASKEIPARATGYPADDQPLFLARVTAGSTAIAELVDLRVWGRAGGVLVARDMLALTYITAIGAVVRIGDREFTRNYDSVGNPIWATNVANLIFSDTAPASDFGNNGDTVVEY